MTLFLGLFAGFFFGLIGSWIWKFMISWRDKERISKAVALQLLRQLNQDDVKKLCGNNYPSWLSFTSFEHVKWLNLQLDQVWPYVALAASKMIELKVEPMLATYCPPGIKMKFAKLFLGTVAPHIEGIKIQNDTRGHLIMDLDFKWGGNPSVIIAVETIVGAKFPVQLKNLKVYAVVRVIMKPIEDIPCISGVAISLLSQPKPTVKYNLKLIGGSISSVPWISELIKETVETLITDTLEWPHRIVIPIAQHPVDLSDLERKLQGRLTLTVIRADKLKMFELIGKSDPYVVLYVRKLLKKKTNVIKDNLQPEWNEVFELDVEDKETQSLVLQVMDKDSVADKLIGIAVLPLAVLKDETTEELTLDLASKLEMNNANDNKFRGTISISIKYHVFSKEEQDAAIEAEESFLKARQMTAEARYIDGVMDAVGSVMGGTGQLMIDGASILGRMALM